MRRTCGCAVILLVALLVPAADIAPPPRAVVPPTPKMPLTGLVSAKPMFDACVYRYGVGTANPECQAYLNQALGMYYSYVWMEAARAAETAVTHDPECAYAWLMLHRSLEKWGRGSATPKTAGLAGALGATGFASLPDRLTKSPLDASLDMARKLMPKASHREQLLIQSRLQEKGMWPNTKADERRKKAQQTLDELLMLYDDDQEGMVLAGATGRGRQRQGGLLQGAPPREPAPPRREPRTRPLLRERPPPRARLALRGGVHAVLARHPARLPHAGPPRHADRQVGRDHRLELEGDRTPAGLPQAPGRRTARGPPVQPPHGDA